MLKKTLYACLFPLLVSAVCVAQDATPPASMNVQQAIQFALQHSPRALALERERAVARADVFVEQQWNNPAFVFETTRSQPNYFVGGGYLFELGGKRGKRIAIAESEAKLSEINYRAGLASLRKDVRIAFFAVLNTGQKSTEIAKSRDLAAKLLQIAKDRFEAGDAARLEMLAAELELKRREVEFQKAQNEERSAKAQLQALLNISGSGLNPLSGEIEVPVIVPPMEQLQAGAMQQHLELQLVQQQIKSEEARLGLAKAASIPDLDVEAGTEIHDADFEYGWKGGVRLDLPIFNTGKASVARSDLALESLKAEEAATRAKIQAELNAAYLKYQSALEQTELFKKEILPESEEIEQLSEEGYREGQTGILAVLEAQRNIREIRLEYLDSVMELQTAIAELESAAGVELP